MRYDVKLTDYALEQLQEIHRYIARTLQAPDAAAKWMQRIKKEMSSLDCMPNRFPLTEEASWRSEGIRKMPADNFIVYYWVNEEASTVWVTAVVYGRRDQLMALRTIPNEFASSKNA